MTAYSATTVWVLILVIGAGTFSLRISMIALLGRIPHTPPALERVLRFIRPAVLAALIAPSVVFLNGEPTFIAPFNPRLVAALIAISVAWKTRNVLATIIGGMSVLWILQVIM